MATRRERRQRQEEQVSTDCLQRRNLVRNTQREEQLCTDCLQRRKTRNRRSRCAPHCGQSWWTHNEETCVLQQRQGLSTGLASSVSSRRDVCVLQGKGVLSRHDVCG